MWITDYIFTRTRLLISFLLIGYASIAQNNQKIALANQYQNKGELEKSYELYKSLATNSINIPFIHNNYLEVLDNLRLQQEAINYLQNLIDSNPANIIYKIDLLDVHLKESDTTKADGVFDKIKNFVKRNPNQIRRTAQYLNNVQHFSYTEQIYILGRDILKDPSAFALQLANLYRYLNNKDRMIQEYLLFAESSEGSSRYVKNMLQMTLSDEEDLRLFVRLMMERIQKQPNNELFAEMLIWAHIQLENFYAAFIQARALDKRAKLAGYNSLEIGELAYANRQYDVAERIFTYVAETYSETNNYILAKNWVIETKEQQLQESESIDPSEIRVLIRSYQQLINESGVSKYTLESKRRKALLHAFYLQEFDSAVNLLTEVMQSAYADADIVSQSKLDLGDIYILKEEPWESKLLYYQVEKNRTNSIFSEKAKLKNAKLSYFRGDFSLAQEQLDVIKTATSREISNDAINLSLLIKNNTILDSTQAALKAYANLELLLYQNKEDQVLDSLNKYIELYKDHPLLDELYYLNAKIEKKRNNYSRAIEFLTIIYKELPYDILTDDALYEIAEIYNYKVKNKEKAQTYYQKLLVDFPNSIYTSESRKKFRHLRGDVQ